MPTPFRSMIRLALGPALALCAAAAAASQVAVLGRENLGPEQLYPDARVPAKGWQPLRLTFAYFPAVGWQAAELATVAGSVARVLGQCRVRISGVEMVALAAATRFHDFHTRESRELAQAIPLRRPAVYFVADTRELPAFDAEAIGRDNSRTRPELVDTVWVTRGSRDLAVVVAHELAHVLLNSGGHSRAPLNLMRSETASANTKLDAAQCARLRRGAAAHDLMEDTGR